MALIIADRVKETTITEGTGTITLSGPTFGGFQSFSSAIGEGNTTYYCIQNESNFEIGVGTYSSGTLSRDTVIESSNSGAKISITGVAVVFCVVPSTKLIYKNENGDFVITGDINVDDVNADLVSANSGDFGSILSNGIESSGLLTLTREDAGSFFHAYVDDSNDRTISLHSDAAVAPTWKLGLKNSPSSETDAPAYAYIYGSEGSIGLVGNSDNQITISNSSPFIAKHQGVDVITAHYVTGVHLQSNSSAYPALIVNGGAALSADIQRWNNNAGTTLSVVDNAGNFGIRNSNPSYQLDVTGTGNFSQSIRFGDGTVQSTAYVNSSGELQSQITTNTAASGSLQSQITSNAAVSGALQPQITTNAAVSGVLQSQISDIESTSVLSGVLQPQITENSQVAIYASGHNLQSVTGNGSTTTNAITVSNNNITASSGLFNTLDMTPLAEASYPAHQEGVVFYDVDNHTLSLYNDEADVTLQLGQEEFLRVRNNTGATITNGTAVLITGSHGNAAPTISGAIATSESASQIVGLATHDIEDSSFGYVTTYGIVRNVDTSHCAAGDEIFLSATEVGSGVNVSPTIPNYKVTIGHVIRSHGSNGSILVQIGNAKLGGGDLKSEAELNVSGVPFVTTKSDTTAGGSQTDPLFIFDSGNRQLQLGSGLQLLDGVPTNTTNVLYNNAGTLTFNGSAVGGSSTSGIVFEKSGSNDEFRIGTTFIDADGTEQVVRATDFNGGYLRLEVARFSPSVSANGQSRSWDQPVTQWSVTVDNPTDFTTNYVSGVKSPLTGITGSVTSDVTLYSTSGPSVTPGGGVDWTQTFSTDGDSPIYSSTNDLTGGSASATVSFLDKNQATISETATITFNWSTASNSIAFANLSGKNFLERYTTTTYNLTINNISDLSNTSTAITTNAGTLTSSTGDGTITFTTPIHKDNNSGRTITATTDFTRPATVTGTEYTSQDVNSDSTITATFTYPSFYIFTSSTSNPPSRADIVDSFDFDSANVTELSNELKVIDQQINNPDGVPKCWWFAVRSAASQPTTFKTGSDASLLVGVTPTETTVDLEPDIAPVGYNSEEYKLYGITLNPGNTYVQIS